MGPLGDRSWGQVREFPGSLRELRGRGEAGRETPYIQGKQGVKAVLPTLQPQAGASMVRRGLRFESAKGLYTRKNTCKSASSVVLVSIREHLIIAPGALSELACRPQKHLQIELLPVTTEHLPETEELAAQGRRAASKIAGGHFPADPSWLPYRGTGFGDI